MSSVPSRDDIWTDVLAILEGQLDPDTLDCETDPAEWPEWTNEWRWEPTNPDDSPFNPDEADRCWVAEHITLPPLSGGSPESWEDDPEYLTWLDHLENDGPFIELEP